MYWKASQMSIRSYLSGNNEGYLTQIIYLSEFRDSNCSDLFCYNAQPPNDHTTICKAQSLWQNVALRE